MSIEDIRKSAEAGQLIVVLGAGSSIALTQRSKKALLWTGLVRSGLDYGHVRRLISDGQYSRYSDALASDDIDDLLSAAEFVSRKLGVPTGSPYARWMESVFKDCTPEAGGMQNALRAINRQRIQIATLNYDTLAEACTGTQAIDFADTEEVMAWARRDRSGVLHIHGVWSNPGACVFGIRDYLTIASDEKRDFIQRWFSTLNRLLFIGCGDTLSDPNFSSLIAWLRTNIGSNALQHYALVRNDEVDRRFADPSWRGFVEPIGYGPDHSDLPGFLLSCFPTKASTFAKSTKAKFEAARDAQVIDAYRNFLLRDCGEMTIEGMRADMDTAQRKFDLEKLFVPLEVTPFPPDIPIQDPNREAKLEDWQSSHSDPLSFGKVFEEIKRIALLALPGGGKTVLLKRIAVAYAQPSRRELSSDDLPSVDLLPVMIRCREWKDEIRKPIWTLLQHMETITGESSLKGLAQALSKPLKSGNVILLVDGLDEIHNDGDRAVFVDNLERFLTTYPKIRLLVTSREAGFDLVAPCLVRFCEKYRIAPLGESAITSLCLHWHRLMSGSSPEALAEAENAAKAILNSDPLRRLAENPLLLTMLLVVKHGAGRLPPDRVSLYSRAVDVLLDTWNIRGHEALNVKEAEPQLACLAFELLSAGKQTATEKEILDILNRARDVIPLVGRYAKDSPHDFLKRVELRSSLMVEGGHTSEDGQLVPFYQFRHLTFQEYLAAVAVVEGYCLDAEKRVSLISALDGNLVSDEWKEVVPMAAVLGRKQSEDLLEALTVLAEDEKERLLTSKLPSLGKEVLGGFRLPPATGCLAQAMSEEAIFPSRALDRAASVVATFANGCRTNDNWRALSRGPYGQELRDAAFENFAFKDYRNRILARNTLALLEAYSKAPEFWLSPECENITLAELESEHSGSLCRSILAVAGSFWLHRSKAFLARTTSVYAKIEELLGDNRFVVLTSAAWAWSFWRFLQEEAGKEMPVPTEQTISRLVGLFFEDQEDGNFIISFAVSHLKGVKRNYIKMHLSRKNKKYIRRLLKSDLDSSSEMQGRHRSSILRIVYILDELATDGEIKDFVSRNPLPDYQLEECEDIYSYFKIPRPKKRRARPRKVVT